jgi:hypothetical protein
MPQPYMWCYASILRLQSVGQTGKCWSSGIEFSLQDYLELVDDTGRIIRADKRGAISALNVNSAKLLARLNIPADNWLKLTTEFGKLFHGPVGTLQELSNYCEHLEKRRRHFLACCQHLKAS